MRCIGLVGAAAMLGGAPVQVAAQRVVPFGARLAVSPTCSVTAGVVDLGMYNAGDTVATYAARQGKWDFFKVSTGTDAPKTLATVDCDTATANWSLVILGSGFRSQTEVLDPRGNRVFNVLPYSETVGGVAKTGAMTSATAGTGSQAITGRWVVVDASAAQLATVLVPGVYTGSATATLTY